MKPNKEWDKLSFDQLATLYDTYLEEKNERADELFYYIKYYWPDQAEE